MRLRIPCIVNHFEVEKPREFYGCIGEREAFPVKHYNKYSF